MWGGWSGGREGGPAGWIDEGNGPARPGNSEMVNKMEGEGLVIPLVLGISNKNMILLQQCGVYFYVYVLVTLVMYIYIYIYGKAKRDIASFFSFVYAFFVTHGLSRSVPCRRHCDHTSIGCGRQKPTAAQ